MRRSILIIERDEIKASRLRKILLALDFHVYHNDSFEASKALMLSFRPDFAICEMPSDQHLAFIDLSQFLFNKSIPFVAVIPGGANPIFNKIKQCNPQAIYTDEVDEFGLTYLLEKYMFDNKEQVNQDKLLSIKQGTKYRMIRYDDIIYFIANANGVTIVTNEGDIDLTSSLKSIMRGLDQSQFIRIHRNYMVNISKITLYEAAQSIVYINDVELPTGRVYKAQVSKVFKKLISSKG